MLQGRAPCGNSFSAFRECELVVILDPTAIGLIAGAFTSFASLPQIIYVLRTRSMKDISLITLSMFAFGVTLWLCYGIRIHAVPIIVWNATSLTLYVTQIVLKVYFSSGVRVGFTHRGARTAASA